MDDSIDIKLKNYLNLYWLRPENGLIAPFKSRAFENLKIESPSLDLSCGDGMFMAIHLGAIFDFDFDYFKSTKASEFSHSNVIDIYDDSDTDYPVNYIKKPSMKIDYGTDWKQALLDKAAKLDLYENLVLHDNNKLPLPFADNYFKTIYSNSIYWIKKPEELLPDMYRITAPGGNVAIEVLTPSRYEILYKLEKVLSPKAIEILDRKRRENTQGMREYHVWKEMIENAGFKIKQVKSVYPHKMIMDFWNIGLRPISHLLIQMANALDDEERKKIKKEWIDIFFELFKPLFSLKQSHTVENAPYLSFLLEK
jgi:SAM-dependent methyltransferase